MNEATLADAKQQAERLIARIDVLQGNLKAQEGNKWRESFPKLRGAVKRQSMELTRSLAQLRKPG